MNQKEDCPVGVESLLQRFDEKRFELEVSQTYFDRIEAITKLQDNCQILFDSWVESYILNLSKKELSLLISSCDDAIAKVIGGLVELQENLLSKIGHSKDKGERLIEDYSCALHSQAKKLAIKELSTRSKERLNTILLAGTLVCSALGAFWSYHGAKDQAVEQALTPDPGRLAVDSPPEENSYGGSI